MSTMRLSVRSLATVLALALLVPAMAFAEATTWQVDPAHTGIQFSVRHFFSQVPGRFNDFSGTIKYDPESPSSSSVEFTIQAASINTDNADRDNHLRSADFFDVEKHPTLSFKSTEVKAVSDGKLEVTGDFTVRGVTKRITVPVVFLGSMDTPMGTRAGFHTEFKVDRKEYGVSWNRALDQGGAILGDEVRIEIAVEAVKKSEEAEQM